MNENSCEDSLDLSCKMFPHKETVISQSKFYRQQNCCFVFITKWWLPFRKTVNNCVFVIISNLCSIPPRDLLHYKNIQGPKPPATCSVCSHAKYVRMFYAVILNTIDQTSVTKILWLYGGGHFFNPLCAGTFKKKCIFPHLHTFSCIVKYAWERLINRKFV